MQNFNDTSRNRTSDFPGYSAVPQLTAPSLHEKQYTYIQHISGKHRYNLGETMAQWVEALRYKPEGIRVDSRSGHWNSLLTYSFRLHYCPEVDSWEVKVAGVWG
jgi:hypothetical protein